MNNLALELLDALRAGNRPRLIDAIRKLRELLATIDLTRVAELLKQVMDFLDELGILPAPAASAAEEAEVQAACQAACGLATADEATAQALDLTQLMVLVKLIIELVRRFTKPGE